MHANRPKRKNAQDTADLVIEAGGRSRWSPRGDLTDPDSPGPGLSMLALDAFGRLDSIVANASIRPEATIENLSYDAWRECLMSILSGQRVPCSPKASLPSLLEEQEWGNCRDGWKLSGPHSATVCATCRCSQGGCRGSNKRRLHRIWAKKGITVNCIAPGLIDTTRDFGPAKSSRSKNFVGRRGRPEGSSSNGAGCYWPNGRYITGQTIHVNGGALMV